MSVFKHVESGKRFFFIHIPRTAGRFIELNLKAEGWEWENVNEDIKLTRLLNLNGPPAMYDSVEGIEIAHFHKELYKNYFDIKDIPHIAIIRNPIDRFISSSVWLNRHRHATQQQIENSFSSALSSLLDDPNFPESINWFRSQIDFISDKTHIWKFEDGIGNKFSNWISNIVDVNIKMNPTLHYWASDDSIFWANKFKKTDTLVNNIKTFYKKDISKFYKEIDE